MKKTDRVILLFLIIGIWAFVGTLWFKPNLVVADDIKSTQYDLAEEHQHSTNDISKFKWKVRQIVEDCSVVEEEIFC